MSNTIINNKSFDYVILADTSGNPVNPPSGPVSTTVTPTLASVTGAFTIAAGASGFTVANIGSANGILDGVTVAAGTTVEWPVVQGATYTSLSGDATGTTFLIAKVV
jgi:hypothetical protein